MEWIEQAKRRSTIVLLAIIISSGGAGFKFSDTINAKQIGLLNEKIKFNEKINQNHQSNIKRLEEEIKNVTSKSDGLQVQLESKDYSGYWKHSWGDLVIHQYGKRVKGILLAFNGKSFLLDGLVENQKYEFDWVRYSKQDIVENGIGHLNLQEGKVTLKGSWRDSAGIWIAVSAQRYKPPLSE